MAEIKSTLELILEKTRNMTLSDEERREQALKELREKINGLLLKYLDGHVDLSRLQEELERLNTSVERNRTVLVAEVALNRLDPDNPSPRALELLMQVCALSADDLSAILASYQQTMSILSARYSTELSTVLKDKRGIWGSSVRVNVKADPTWTAEHARVKEQVLSRLREAIRSAP